MTSRGITVRYLYSACIVTSTPDVRILHDPWFSDGVYDGSWFQFPKLQDPIAAIGDVDAIYVSHLHPDHYDARFLRDYFERYGRKEVLIADHQPNHLANKMRADGIAATVLSGKRRIGATEIELWPHRTGSTSDIDSALILRYHGERTHCAVNANDIIFDAESTRLLKEAAGDTDILLCGYTGAGPYPQTYYDLADPRLPVEAEKKKNAFFQRYRTLTDAFQARCNIPFAGKYMLGGKLTALNPYRGVADAVEVLAFDPRAVVLADGGGEIDTGSLRPSATRTQPYDPAEIRRRESEIAHLPMDYERLIPESEIHQLPLKRLLAMAAKNASRRSEVESDYFFVMHLPEGKRAILNARHGAEQPLRFTGADEALPEPRSEVVADPRYLFGLLTHVYHWNNAEVGSQYRTVRVPNELNRAAQAFLNYLAV